MVLPLFLFPERRRQTFDETVARETPKSKSASESGVLPTPITTPTDQPTPQNDQAGVSTPTVRTTTAATDAGGGASRPPALVTHRSYAKKVYERSRAAIILTKNLLLNLLYAHLDKVTLVFLYAGGMQRMDGIHATFLFFLFIFFTFSDFNLQRCVGVFRRLC